MTVNYEWSIKICMVLKSTLPVANPALLRLGA